MTRAEARNAFTDIINRECVNLTADQRIAIAHAGAEYAHAAVMEAVNEMRREHDFNSSVSLSGTHGPEILIHKERTET